MVDGDSSDGTLSIAREFAGIQIIESKDSSLTRDRQKGLDAAKNQLVAMIDADHRLKPDDLKSLLKDMVEFNFDIVQSGLISHANHGFWDSAEDASWELTQNIPGLRNMVGTAPAIYNKRVFEFARFIDFQSFLPFVSASVAPRFDSSISRVSKPMLKNFSGTERAMESSAASILSACHR